jgi:putative nucleotidyltransferase-like protein
VSANGLGGAFWPSDRQTLLLRAALLEGERGAAAWRELRPSFRLDDLDPASTALLPLLHRQLERRGDADPLAPRLRGVYRRTWYVNQLRLDRLRGALNALREAEADPLVFSSWELPVRYYDDLGLRPAAALHVLVRPDRVGRAKDALDDDQCHVHSRLFPEFEDAASGLEPEDPWEAATELELGGVAMRTLGPADELLGVCLSGARAKAWPSILWIADAVTVLAAAPSELDWDRLVRQARRIRATLRLRDALVFLRDELGAAVPTAAVAALEATPTTRRERVAHRVTGARHGRLGGPPGVLSRFLRVTADRSAAHAMRDVPRFLRDEWGLDRGTEVSVTALRKAGRRLLGAGENEPR